jgi:hypothetical protein
MRTLGKLSTLATALTVCLAGPSLRPSSAAPSAREAYEIGKEAYAFLYPLVTMDVTRRVMTSVGAGQRPGSGPMNEFSNARAFPSADFRDVVRPNFDTLYSVAWLDLTREPLILSVPDTKGRYYLMPLLDMWTDVFAAPGKRTSGTAAGDFALVPPGWKGRLPRGVERIDTPTPFVWAVGRTQTNGPKDYDAVHEVQKGYRLTPLSNWGRSAKPGGLERRELDVDLAKPPVEQVDAMPARKFFATAADMMKINPPHATDWSQIERLKRIGLEPGKSFDLDAQTPEIRESLEKAAADALAAIKAEKAPAGRIANGWRMNTEAMGVYGIDYFRRAVVARVALGANQPRDAIYPIAFDDADGKPLDGQNKYVLHFAKGELPPVDAFWSVTLYDEKGFAVANSLNRFALGDRDALRFNADGSLDLYFQSVTPGAKKEQNWLPSPSTGTENVTMRLYAPKPQALDGRWSPPPIRRAK